MKIKQQEQNNGNTRKTLLLAQLDLQRQPQDTHFKVSKFRWNKALHSDLVLSMRKCAASKKWEADFFDSSK